MALNIPSAPFPIFSPSPPATSHRPSTELRLSRWNNANAEPFIRRRRAQEQIERDLRLHRKYQSINNLTQIQHQQEHEDQPSSPPPSTVFKSSGTPSSPSSPSIPGRRSKYSKPPRDPKQPPHPAFRKIRSPRFAPEITDPESGISLSERGISYRIKNAPFEFQYSYTETPKVKPLALREQPYLPFGPGTMPRPWTGRKPLPESKKKLPEFDSFRPPPAGKKGVKPVQSPGPFLMGAGPKVKAMTREEVIGEPLTEAEVKELIKGCVRTRRQLNMGRDGLTHNMLDNIHAHWKRRRVCKIKCLGVCTVDMDNVRQQLEEKTGGKIIYSKGGVVYLFRGRNYNYRTRPRFPLMLWKPVAPVYPRLVQRAPEGLTLEEATEMRRRGRRLPPICKLGKNGVYTKLVKNVKEAFEACELVRINCEGMNRSDCRKIGAKLQDLVPCVLLSFEYEHILMWRGKDWKSSLPPIEDDSDRTLKQIAVGSTTTSFSSSDQSENSSNKDLISAVTNESIALIENVHVEEDSETSNTESLTDYSIAAKSSDEEPSLEILQEIRNSSDLSSSGVPTDEIGSNEDLKLTPAGSLMCSESVEPESKYLDGVKLLLKQAVDGGSAVVLNSEQLDANIVYEKCVALAKSAPAGPTFKRRVKKIVAIKTDIGQNEICKEEDEEVEAIEIVEESIHENTSISRRREAFKEVYLDTVPHGSLRVDELAKLLA